MIQDHTVVHEESCRAECPGIPTTLRYDRSDPVAVTVVFREDPAEKPSEWVFSRDLLVDGMDAKVGLGDVQIWPDGDRLIVAITDAACAYWVPLRFDLRIVRKFLARTRRAVPYQREHVDVDGLIERIEQWGARQ